MRIERVALVEERVFLLVHHFVEVRRLLLCIVLILLFYQATAFCDLRDLERVARLNGWAEFWERTRQLEVRGGLLVFMLNACERGRGKHHRVS